MSPLPPAFRRDAARIGQLSDAFSEHLDEGPATIRHAKQMARELRHLLARWSDNPACQAEGRALADFQTHLASLERHLEQFYRASLRELLSQWRNRHIHELLLRGEIITHQIVQGMPTEELLIALKKAITDGKPETYDPEGDYRKTQHAADTADAAYRAEWAEFQATWPERIDAAFRTRLETLTIADLNAWTAELSPE